MILPATPSPNLDPKMKALGPSPGKKPPEITIPTYRRELSFAALVGGIFGTLLAITITAEMIYHGALPLATHHKLLAMVALILIYSGAASVLAAGASCLLMAVCSRIKKEPIQIGILRGTLIGLLAFFLLAHIAVEPDLGRGVDFSLRYVFEWGVFLFLDAVICLVLGRIAAHYYRSGKAPPRERRTKIIWTSGGIGLVLVCLFSIVGFPDQKSLSMEYSRVPDHAPLPLPEPARQNKNLLFLGIEGLTEIPPEPITHPHTNLSHLIDRGVTRTFPVENTSQPASSWATILTGLPDETHGVPSHPRFKIRGTDEELPGKMWFPSGVGMHSIIRACVFTRILIRQPGELSDCRSPLLWDHLQHSGYRSTVDSLSPIGDSKGPEANFHFLPRASDFLGEEPGLNDLLQEADQLLSRIESHDEDWVVVLVGLPSRKKPSGETLGVKDFGFFTILSTVSSRPGHEESIPITEIARFILEALPPDDSMRASLW